MLAVYVACGMQLCHFASFVLATSLRAVLPAMYCHTVRISAPKSQHVCSCVRIASHVPTTAPACCQQLCTLLTVLICDCATSALVVCLITANGCNIKGCSCISAVKGECVCDPEDHTHIKHSSVGGASIAITDIRLRCCVQCSLPCSATLCAWCHKVTARMLKCSHCITSAHHSAGMLSAVVHVDIGRQL